MHFSTLMAAAFAVIAALPSTTAARETDLAEIYSGLALRDIGPAMASGRISDFAMHPDGWHVFYAATASGGLWKTANGGITWKPIFDNEGSYSIGVVEIDPRDPNVVWVGTGEDNSQRSVAFGDGVYKSVDGGASWTNVGLDSSEHIGMISIDPRDSDVVYVAAQGPLWNDGGDRGVYKTSDGGKNWEQVLAIDEHTGASEVLIHPARPDVLLASTYQRRRHVWTLINGGPGSGIHRSTDGGRNWQKITAGLPKNDMGKVGIAFAPSNPDIVYAIIETDDEHEGTYRSTDFGASWEKRSDYSAGSPQYYNELVVDPHDPDRVYSMDTFMQVSEDGGKTWNNAGSEHTHVDEHAMWIDPSNTAHLITGNDGGIYESWDRGANWRFVANLPITQFYRATPDNDLPFYNVYGGTQDNSTLGGPSRTRFKHGIANQDWIVTLGGDGFKTQIDPTNPDTVYSQLQYGVLARFDRTSWERVIITPMPGAGELTPKWNWNSAFIISPHDPRRLYFAAEKIFRSDDGGNGWRAVSPDLSRRLDRNQLEVMGRVWSVNAVAKNNSTSMYGSIISLAESPLIEGLIYAGTDDGLVQVSDDGGNAWTRVERFGKTPDMSYVGDLAASLHDADTVYVTLDNHKRGDFAPYVLKSTDRGRRWTSIAGDLPERGTAHTIVEDHVDPNLLFVGTEFGVFFTQNGGAQWIELKGGMPTIAVRDLEIQRRENDLVLATFGRGIRILDDYSPLRTPTASLLAQEAVLFEVRDAWLYAEADLFSYGTQGFQGASFFTAPNPPFGATFSYYLKDGFKTLKDQRRDEERERQKEGGDNPYPPWDTLRAENREEKPELILTIQDASGVVVRRVTGPTGKGFHRVAWDLRLPDPSPVSLTPPGFRPPWADDPVGPLAAPGEYRVSMALRRGGELRPLAPARDFTLKVLERGQFRPESTAAHAARMADASDLARAADGAGKSLEELRSRVAHLKVALRDAPGVAESQEQQLRAAAASLHEIEVALSGDPVLAGAAEPAPMSIDRRITMFRSAHWSALAAVTDNQEASLRVAEDELATVLEDLRQVDAAISAVEAAVAGEARWTPGRVPER